MSDPSLGQKLTLDDLVPRTGLDEMCRSFTTLFDVPLRIFRAGEVIPVAQAPLRYTTAEIRYEGDVLGSILLGPYTPTESMMGLPTPSPDAPPLPPRIKPATVERLIKHVLAMLDVMLWSGHRAFLAAQMQVASAGESYREITAKNRALAESLKALQEVDRLKSNFMGTISHELRTPLTSILGYAEMLSEGIGGGSLTGEQREFVQIIRGKGETLLAMISNILELSKLDTETSPRGPVEVDLGAFCEDLVAAAEGAAVKRNVALGLFLEPELPRVEIDVERARKVVAHLLDNAIKFTTPGGTVHMTVVTETPPPEELSPVGLALLAPANQRIVLTVTDTGIGISPEHLPHVFDAFYQVDGSSTREYGGSGLGLAIVRRLTESLGGSVTAASDPGHGSTFRLVLPVAP